MIGNLVKRVGDAYARMTPQERRDTHLEIVGGVAGGILLNIAPLPFADYAAILFYGYAAYKGAPVVAYQIQSRLQGPRSVTISSNQEIKGLSDRLRKSYQELEVFRNSVYSERDGTLVLDTGDTGKSYFTRAISLIPGLSNVVTTMSDPLETIEGKFRSYLNTITADVIRLAQIAKAKQNEIKELERKLGEMRENNLGIAEIMNYMLKKAPEIRQEAEVMAFFTSGMEESISLDLREQRRQQLLTMLNDKLETMRLGQLAMSSVAINAREIYFRALQQYDAFVAIRPQLQAARDTTLTVTDTSNLSTSAPDYIKELIRRTGEANKVLLDGLDIIDKTLIASPETVRALRESVTDFYSKAAQKGLIGTEAVKAITQGSIEGKNEKDKGLEDKVIDV